jgi:hypothetical protein
VNRQEVAQVLTKIQLLDNRQVDGATLAAWFELIGGLEFADALEGVNLHRLEQPGKWLEPGHVVAGARRAKDVREREARRQRPAIVPAPFTFDAAQHRKEFEESLAEHRRSKGVSDVVE